MLITDLPTEIQSCIFSEIYLEERRSPPILYGKDNQWREDLKILFPQSTASVCRLWQDILRSTPKYWTRFVLDLNDPACLPFDVFGWSQSANLDVVILSHPQETSDNTKKYENSQVSSAFKALTPYIPSCKSIVFDVKYASSLPPPTPFLIKENPHLKTLIMDPEIDDVVLPISLGIAPGVTIGQKISIFKRLSLYGAAFMELSRIDPTWLEHEWISFPSTALTLSHLECCWETGSSYKIYELLHFLFMITTVSDFTFKHARFVGPQPPEAEDSPGEEEFIIPNSLTFENTDPDFISAFAPWTFDNFIMKLTFKSCIVPRLNRFWNLHLHLIDIPGTESLKNIIFHHDGAEITFTSCPGFNDDFLDWFATNRCCPTLRILTINKCDHFTATGLRAFVGTRKAGKMDGMMVPQDENQGGEEDNDYKDDENYTEDHITGGDNSGMEVDGRGQDFDSALDDSDSDFNGFPTCDARAVVPIEKLIVQSSGLRLTGEDEIWFKEYTDEAVGFTSWVEDDYCFNCPLVPPPIRR